MELVRKLTEEEARVQTALAYRNVLRGPGMIVRFGFVAMSMLLENASPSRTMTFASFSKLDDREAALRKLERTAEENLKKRCDYCVIVMPMILRYTASPRSSFLWLHMRR